MRPLSQLRRSGAPSGPFLVTAWDYLYQCALWAEPCLFLATPRHRIILHLEAMSGLQPEEHERLGGILSILWPVVEISGCEISMREKRISLSFFWSAEA